jgi:hypothetical protein
MGKRALLICLAGAAAAMAADFRLGIVGTDTSHVPAFTRTFNDPAAPDHIPGFKVVAAYKGGSKDLESSWNRVDKYAEEISTKWGVEIVPEIRSMCGKVDGFLLESVDGRPHLAQAKEIITCGKPMFIDKPLSSTLDDAREIARLAKAANVPWFSASSLRYSELINQVRGPETTGAITWGPGPLEEHHQLDLTWYAIHPIEMLYTLMGTGCEEVSRTYTEGADVLVGRWKDGRLGVVRANRPYSGYGAIAFQPKQILQSDPKAKMGYGPMLVEVANFFKTGKPPVPNEETLEMFAFMDAAQRSKAAGGAPVKLR